MCSKPCLGQKFYFKLDGVAGQSEGARVDSRIALRRWSAQSTVARLRSCDEPAVQPVPLNSSEPRLGQVTQA